MTSQPPNTAPQPPGGILAFLAANPGYALGAAAPVVAIALLLAHLFAHLRGGFAWFIWYLGLTAAVIGIFKSAGLVRGQRTGLLKVGGTVVRRADDPGQFKLWAGIVTAQTVVYVVAAIALVWVAVRAP